MYGVPCRFSLGPRAVDFRYDHRFSFSRIRPLRSDGKGLPTCVVSLGCCLLSLMLSGCGVQMAGGGLSVSPRTISFGTVSLGQTAVATVSLINGQGSSVRLSQVQVAGASFTLPGQGSVPVTIPAGGTYTLQVQFNPTAAGAATGQVTISSNASADGTTVIGLNGTGMQQASGTPGQVSGLACDSSSVTGAGTDLCTVTLSAPAGSSGATVTLSSSNAAVTVPGALTIPASATSAQFPASISAVGTPQTVTLSAAAAGISANFALQLHAAISMLTANATTVAFGDVAPQTTATQTVTLLSTGIQPVTVTAVSATGAGFSVSGLTLPLTLNPGQSTNLEVQFAPGADGAAAGQLTILSNGSINSTIAIGLSGTGAMTYEVNLSWDAPASSADPITGYNVYRSAGAGYQFLNAVSGGTTYVDGSVQDGQTYNYQVTSVDASGVESSPSNIYTANIP